MDGMWRIKQRGEENIVWWTFMFTQRRRKIIIYGTREADYDGKDDFAIFSKSFTMQEVFFNWLHLELQLTPKSWDDFPSAPPDHDAREGEDVMIDSHYNHPLDGFGAWLDVLRLLDNIVVKNCPSVV